MKKIKEFTNRRKREKKSIIDAWKYGDVFTRVSFAVFGLSQCVRGQIGKGILFLMTEIAFVFYMVTTGMGALRSLITLGTQEQGWVMDETKGIEILVEGDNSMMCLLYGVVFLFVVAAFVIIWRMNVISAWQVQQLKENGKRIPKLKEDIKSLADRNAHITLLALPVAGILIFTVLPLVYMILIAFTNYDNAHQPPGHLFHWAGISNFITILGSGSNMGKTFWHILGWTIIWAVVATFSCYIIGILISLWINSKVVKCKKLWRTIIVMSVAVPQFVSLLVLRLMLQPEGAINVMLQSLGLIDGKLPFLTDATWARGTVLIVNLWLGVPYTMLIVTGILMNIPKELYEAASIDGANGFVLFRKITMPYVLFVTTPYLITQFIGNVNNFNVIYLLTTGGPSTLDYYQAGKTDLLVTWLYKLTVSSKDYSYASTIGILVFVISAIVSLVTYRRTSAYNNEEGFQ